MNDLAHLLKLVQINKNVSHDIMLETKYPSHSYVSARGSYGAYCTVETYINNLLSKNVGEET